MAAASRTTSILFFIGLTFIVASCHSPNDYHDDYPPIPVYREFTEIYLENIDGTDDHRITTAQHAISYANFLPNGQKIIYVEYGATSQTVYSISPDGSAKTPLFTDEIYPASNIDHERRMLFTKDSKKIIYTLYRNNNYGAPANFKDIYSINTDGTNKLNISQRNGSKIINGFSLSNDEHRIIYSEFAPDSSSNEICISDIDGTNKRTVKSFGSVLPFYPQFLPSDNNIIVYMVSDKSANYSSVNRFPLTDTAAVTIIASLHGTSVWGNPAPKITPSAKIYFSPLPYPEQIYSIDVFTGERLSIPVRSIPEFSLSDDGAILLWCDGFADIFISATDGSGMRTLSNARGETVRSPFLSPSKKQIIYRSQAQILVE